MSGASTSLQTKCTRKHCPKQNRSTTSIYMCRLEHSHIPQFRESFWLIAQLVLPSHVSHICRCASDTGKSGRCGMRGNAELSLCSCNFLMRAYSQQTLAIHLITDAGAFGTLACILGRGEVCSKWAQCHIFDRKVREPMREMVIRLVLFWNP